MRNIFLIFCFLILVSKAFAQNDGGFSYKAIDIKTPLAARINISNLPDLPEAHFVLLKAAPAPLSSEQQQKYFLDKKRESYKNQAALNKKGAAVAPSVTRNFMGNVTQGTPNDNDVSISNGGMLISCVNTNINIFNDTGKALMGKSLAALASSLGPLNRTYDPRTIYDPLTDRFIIVFLQGSSSVDTRIIVGFSTSNDPTKTWNFYQLPGNITGDSSWSDYPIVSLTKDELFITVNRLKDNTFWKNGFLESYIWQVDKAKGYAGDSLPQRVYNNIKYNDKPVWNICPAKGGSQLYGPEMYFISQRPSDLNNDTVFVHYITNTIQSGKATLGMHVLKTPVPYGLQPNAIQPNGKKLQTNDARVLSAMYEGGVIYYVGNTIDQTLFSPSVYFGRVHDIWTPTPRVEGTIISSDTLDFGYPSIAYVGTGQNGDHSSMITFSHVSPTQFPGTSVVYVDRNFNVSAPVFVKKGDGNIVVISDSVERWGDYTGIQRRYNEVGVAWLNGSYGTSSNQNKTWIARVISNDPLSGIALNQAQDLKAKLYPNPTSELAYFEFELKSKKMIKVELISMDGKRKDLIAFDWAKAGINQLQVETHDLKNGIYFINLVGDEGNIQTFRFVVQH